MSNLIHDRIQYFLKQHQPFDVLNKTDLDKIVDHIAVIYVDSKQYLFKINDEPHAYFYVLFEGNIILTTLADKNENIIDSLEIGDIFGIRPLLVNKSYLLNAKATKPTVVLGIPYAAFKNLFVDYPQINQFFLETLALQSQERLSHEPNNLLQPKYFYDDIIKFNSLFVYTNYKNTIAQAAQLMQENKVGSVIIVNNAKHPLGIVTDKDFRKMIAFGQSNFKDNVMLIASSPVCTIHPQATVSEAQLMMIKQGINHLVVTKDGSNQSEVNGIISSKDLLVMYQNSPSELLKGIKRCQTIEELKLVHQNIQTFAKNKSNDIELFYKSLKVYSLLQQALFSKIVEFSIKSMPNPSPCDFAFFMVGSQGRQEQMLLTDQDHALVYDLDSSENKTHFLALADKIVTTLVDFGYEACPALMMANQDKWCQSLSEWQSTYADWILKPSEDSVLMAQIYFDIGFIYGKSKLIDDLIISIENQLIKNNLFVAYLGKEAINSAPALSFFKSFVLEKEPPHENLFDLKKRILMPLIDLARILVLHNQRLDIVNTSLRYDFMAIHEPENGTLFEQAKNLFVQVLYLRTAFGFIHQNSGRYLDLSKLTKSELMIIKNATKTIESLKQLVTNRLQLNYLN